jgi:hypothetical protein
MNVHTLMTRYSLHAHTYRISVDTKLRNKTIFPSITDSVDESIERIGISFPSTWGVASHHSCPLESHRHSNQWGAAWSEDIPPRNVPDTNNEDTEFCQVALNVR